MEKVLSLRKGQVALEYIMLISFIMAVTIIIISVFSQKMLEIQQSNSEEIAEKIRDMVFDQVVFAQAAMDGYRSEFQMPALIGSSDYNISIADDINFIVVLGGDTEYYYGFPDNVVGTICLNRTDANKEGYYDVAVSRNNGTVAVFTCLNCSVPYMTCYNAQVSGNCALLSADVLVQCQDYHCKCR